MVESSAEESAGKLFLGPRESGMVNTGRSAGCPELLEVGFCSVIPRGRRTSVDVRRKDRWGEDGNHAGVDCPGVVAVEPGREWILLLAAVGLSPTRLARSAEISPMAGMAQCRASRGNADGNVVEELNVPAPSCPHLKPTAGTREPTLGRVVNVEGGSGGGWGGEEGRAGKWSRGLLGDIAREHLER